MDIQMFHLYNRLARRGMVEPLSCEFCEYPYVLGATNDGEPLLQCFSCQSRVIPGLAFYEDMVAVVKEFTK